jgi:hypothetical protein
MAYQCGHNYGFSKSSVLCNQIICIHAQKQMVFRLHPWISGRNGLTHGAPTGVGAGVGTRVGAFVGLGVGLLVGEFVGSGVGALVGLGVGTCNND